MSRRQPVGGARASGRGRRGQLLKCVLSLAVLPCGIAWGTDSAVAVPSNHFEIADYFKVRSISQLALSPDGSRLAYSVSASVSPADGRDPARDTPVAPGTYFLSLEPTATARRIDALAGARSLTWVPGSRALAFLAERGGVMQVCAYDTLKDEVTQLTHAADAVERFRFAPDGKTLGYLTRARVPSDQTLSGQIKAGGTGVVADPDSIGFQDFVDPGWDSAGPQSRARLWVLTGGKSLREIPVPGDVRGPNSDFHWSGDSKLLSVVYLEPNLPRTLVNRAFGSSVGVFDLERGEFEVAAAAKDASPGNPVQAFRGGESGSRAHMSCWRCASP